MRSIYRMTLDRNDWYRYQIEGGHRWSLPAVQCGECGPWAGVGEAYPLVVPDGALGEALEHAPNPSHFEDFRALERLLRSTARVEDSIGPGASFGPFEGTFRGRPLDFVWHEPWTLFAVPRTVELLMEAGVSLPNAAPARPRDKAGAPVELLEFQALPLVPLSERGLARMPSECRSCGRRGVAFDRFRVDSKTTFPEGTNLCRARNNPAVYLASERLVKAVTELKLSGCVFVELERLPD